MVKFGTFCFLILSLCLGGRTQVLAESGPESNNSFCEFFFLVPSFQDNRPLIESPMAQAMVFSLLQEGHDASQLNRADLYALSSLAETNHQGFHEFVRFLRGLYQDRQVLRMLAHLDRELENFRRQEWPVSVTGVSAETLDRAGLLTAELMQLITAFADTTQVLPRDVDGLLSELREHLEEAEMVAVEMILARVDARTNEVVSNENFEPRLRTLSQAITDGRLLFQLLEAHALYCSHDSVWPPSSADLFWRVSERGVGCTPSGQTILASFSDRLPHFESQTLREYLQGIVRESQSGRSAQEIWPWIFRFYQR